MFAQTVSVFFADDAHLARLLVVAYAVRFNGRPLLRFAKNHLRANDCSMISRRLRRTYALIAGEYLPDFMLEGWSCRLKGRVAPPPEPRNELF